jgi:transposase-like protein
MSNRIFSSEQIDRLLENKNVVKCSSKSISYAKEFKISAIRQYAEGMTATQIFRQAGLEPELVGEYVPDDCLNRWRRKCKASGEAGLLTDGRSLGTHKRGRPKTKGLTDVERIKRLQIEVAYLRAENDFLAKLRARGKRS